MKPIAEQLADLDGIQRIVDDYRRTVSFGAPDPYAAVFAQVDQIVAEGRRELVNLKAPTPTPTPVGTSAVTGSPVSFGTATPARVSPERVRELIGMSSGGSALLAADDQRNPATMSARTRELLGLSSVGNKMLADLDREQRERSA